VNRSLITKEPSQSSGRRSFFLFFLDLLRFLCTITEHVLLYRLYAIFHLCLGSVN